MTGVVFTVPDEVIAGQFAEQLLINRSTLSLTDAAVYDMNLPGIAYAFATSVKPDDGIEPFADLIVDRYKKLRRGE